MYRLRAVTGRFKETLVAWISSILLLLSFPPFNFNFLIWVALAPFLKYCIVEETRWRRAFFNGWLVGLIFTFFAENWISHSMTYFGQMLSVLAYAITFFFSSILAIFYGVFALIMFALVKRFGRWAIVLSPIVWPATEYVRTLITGVTWNVFGVSQVSNPFIINPARFGGAYLISAFIISVSAIIVLLLKYKDRACLRATVILILAASSLYLISGTANNEGGEQRRSLDMQVTALGVQPNISPDSTASDETHLDYVIKKSREGLKMAQGQSPDLILWAESPMTIWDNDQVTNQKLKEFTAETGSWLIFNSIGKSEGRYSNSISVVSPLKDNRQMKRYDKIRLVPFGEYVPMRGILGGFVPTIVGDFTPGTEAVVNNLQLQTQRNLLLNTDGATDAAPAGIERTTARIRVGGFICYEAAYQSVVRRFALNGANLLVNLSNDAWFGKTAGPEQHLDHTRMRAIENNRDILRVTNSGISALITADGNVINKLPSFVDTTGLWTASTHSQITFYTRYGDWFAIGCLIVTGISLILIRRRLK